MEYYIGIDLGGTNVAAGVTDRNGRLIVRTSLPLETRGAEGVTSAICQAAWAACDRAGLRPDQAVELGLASPGTVDPERGIVSNAHNLGLEVTPLAGMVAEALGLPVCMENDANAAALGEYVSGCGRNALSLVAVTLGTGVGAGAVLNGSIYTGFNGAAFEAGHMVIHQDGRPCNCGRRGCWETYASATGLIRTTQAAMEADQDSALWRYASELAQVTGKTAFDAAQAGDETARQVVEAYTSDLACGIVNLINLFQPEVLCIGGGVSRQGENLLKPIRAVLEREEFTRNYTRRTKICTAELGEDAGVIGAAMLPLACGQQGT